MKRKKLSELPVIMPGRQIQGKYSIVPHREQVDGEEHVVLEIYYSRNLEPSYRN